MEMHFPGVGLRPTKKITIDLFRRQLFSPMLYKIKLVPYHITPPLFKKYKKMFTINIFFIHTYYHNFIKLLKVCYTGRMSESLNYYSFLLIIRTIDWTASIVVERICI